MRPRQAEPFPCEAQGGYRRTEDGGDARLAAQRREEAHGRTTVILNNSNRVRCYV